MITLALIHGNSIISTIYPGGWFDLPNGSRASPAHDGWTDGEYRLAAIQPADTVPEGKRVVSTDVQLIDGQPRYVHVLEDVPLPPIPETISRRQFYQGLAVTGKITQAEALAAIKTGAVPTALQAMLDQMTDADAKFEADMLLSGAADFNRDHPLVMVIAIAQAMTELDVDDFWRLCAGL